MGPIFQDIVNDARSCRAYGSAALEIISVAKGQLAAISHLDYSLGTLLVVLLY